MKRVSNRVYGVGLILLIIGGVGLVDANSNISFWIYTIMFSVGFGCCLTGYIR